MGVKSAIAVLRAGLRFARPHGSDGRVREHNARNHVVLQPPFNLTAEQAIAQAPTGGDCHRRQGGAAGHITDCIDARDVGILEGIGNDKA